MWPAFWVWNEFPLPYILKWTKKESVTAPPPPRPVKQENSCIEPVWRCGESWGFLSGSFKYSKCVCQRALAPSLFSQRPCGFAGLSSSDLMGFSYSGAILGFQSMGSLPVAEWEPTGTTEISTSDRLIDDWSRGFKTNVESPWDTLFWVCSTRFCYALKHKRTLCH